LAIQPELVADWNRPLERSADTRLSCVSALNKVDISVFVPGNLMGSSASRARTRIVGLTGEVGLLRLMRSILEPNGCEVVGGALALDGTVTGQPVDIVIADLESFDREGLDLDLLTRLRRAYPGAEMIAISREYREGDCIAVLDVDVDYLPRPFSAQDLAARVRVAELRRFKAAGHKRFYRRGSFVVDLFDRAVALDGESIALAPSELSVLTVLASRPGCVTTFGDILAGVGRAGSASGRQAVRTSVFRLRRKIERDPKHPVILLTEAGVGYRLAPEKDDVSGRDLPPRRLEPEQNRPP
jgi:two-component system, OmpR family, KDP operon response regulator KdpE